MSLIGQETLPRDTKKHASKIIACAVCKRPRCYTKYRRHLLTHVKNGEITMVKVHKVLFNVRIPRCDMKNRYLANSQSGYMCHYRDEFDVECKHIVLNLKRHLLSKHKLNRLSSKFQDLMKGASKEKPLKRLSRNCRALTSESGDTFDQLNRTISSEQVLNNSHTPISVDDATQRLNHNPVDATYIIPEESDLESLAENDMEGESTLTMSTPVTLIPQVNLSYDTSSLRFADYEKIIREFHSFLLTKGGGGRRNTPIKGDLSSFRTMVKELGWDNIWDPNRLNYYVSSATCSPSTLYCRLRVYERFIHFLRMRIPSLLPSLEQLNGINSMLSNLKEAIGKDSHLRNKHTMAVSRERMPVSFNVLRSWRFIRASVEIKKYFALFEKRTEFLTELLFRELRNYLIVEILLANAQRSGIIEGMLIKEVVQAKSNVNSDNLHYIYVENHKTGYIQAAIIYLEAEIYHYLLTYVTIILSLLPCIQHSRIDNSCHVFQTWTSDILRTSTISCCLRSGLKLFGIDDPQGCPTNYRKAASTLISMHNPSMQEPLSQFMCHARSTTERHYRHHMSHKSLSSVFNELAKCQSLPSEDGGTTSSKMLRIDLPAVTNDQIVTFSDNNTVENISISCIQNDEVVDLENDLDSNIASILENSMNISSDSDETCLSANSTHL